MIKEKLVHLAGVMVTNGVTKFHVIGENQAMQKYVQLPMPLMVLPSWKGSFVFTTFPTGVTKLEAAKAMLASGEYKDSMKTCLETVIAKATPKVKVPKVPKEPKVKAAVAPKPVKAAKVGTFKGPALEVMKKLTAAKAA